MSKILITSNIIVEVQGQRVRSGIPIKFNGFVCPFTDSDCIKKSAKIVLDYYPVCTVSAKSKFLPITVCPKRFYSIDLMKEVLTHAWRGEKPVNPKIAFEVRMGSFGTIDFVVADFVDGKIDRFVSCEIQAVDTTGSMVGFFRDAILGKQTSVVPKDKVSKRDFSFNFNKKNVAKRYLSQLIYKGHHHHLWESTIVAVVQKPMYDYFQEQASFKVDRNIQDPNSNIIFLVYDYVENSDGELNLELVDVAATHHSSIQTANLYKKPPSKSDFKDRILLRLNV